MPKQNTERRGAAPSRDTSDPAKGERIMARIRSELPAREGKRRARWPTAELERIVELARDAQTTLTEVGDAGGQGERTVQLDRIIATAERLLAARRSPGASPSQRRATEVQVAYLVPLEVVVDLDRQVVTKVVVIDEAIELDLDEGARTASTLAPLAPHVAQTAIRLAELEDGGEWPAMQFGW